jgi:peptidoglycan/xylan/chitin deacetylase (PgdA/CDA1 family)
MTPEELQEVAREGADIQLHTHRHRSPDSRLEFRREVLENRERIEAITGRSAVHLCYPSGRHRPEFFPWLEELQVITATTCVPSLASRASSRLALPRVVDTSFLGEIELEGWLSGVSQFLWQRPVRGEPSPMPASLVVAR